MKSWKIPTPDQVQAAIAQLNHVERQRYFFQKLNNPEWLQPLTEKGFFQNPPSVNHDEKKGTISFPSWPESQYLIRVAGAKPEQALKIIMSIDTENISIHEDFADVALAIDSKYSVEWAKKEIAWLSRTDIQFFRLYPEKIGALINHLAKGGHQNVALELARIFFDILPDETIKKEQSDKPIYFSPEPRAKFDLWEYEEVFKKYIPDFIRVVGMPVFEELCNLLEKTIKYSRRRDEDTGPEDYSYIWRQSIEHSKEHSHGIQNILTTAIRDAGKILIDEKNELAVIANLLNRKWKIFTRVALHLLMLYPEKYSIKVSQVLTNVDIFNDYGIRHEYVALLRKSFSILEQKDKKIILGWINAGPDLSKFKDAEFRLSGKEVTEEQIQKYALGWKRDRYSWIVDDLTDELKGEYQALVKQLGEPQDSDLPFRLHSGWVGPTSPLTIEQLKAMSSQEISDFLRKWKPLNEMMSPSREGLGRVLNQIAKDEPHKFIAESISFENLHPTYVRSILGGVAEATQNGISSNNDVILKLCSWVLKQPVEWSGDKDSDSDQSWEWTRNEIARLISRMVEEDRIDYKFRFSIFELIQLLTNDPNPTVEYEQHVEGMRDYATLSINATRGEGMHALIRYALWVRKNILKDDPSALIDFKLMPEVEKILMEHLDPSKEKTLTVRAVYGQWLPWLIWLDVNWVRVNLKKIFPETTDQFWTAAWQTYIIFCAPYNNAFAVLESEYSKAIDVLKPNGEVASIDNPESHLAEHLMVYYWRDLISEPIFDKFWIKASEKIRGYAISYIGHVMYEGEEPVPQEIQSRLIKLWEQRFEIAKSEPAKHISEVNSFGWWFSSKKFDNNWAIQQLISCLEMSGDIEPSHHVVDTLAELVEVFPVQVVRALGLIIKKQKENWNIYSWREKSKEILGKALLTDAKQEAVQIIQYLGSIGFLEFGSLLKP